MARKPKSWWQLKKIRHRDAILLASISSAFLLAGEVQTQAFFYQQYLKPVSGNPLAFVLTLALIVLAFTTYFGGILVLMGGVNFLWNRVARGRFLVSLGVGLSFLGLARQFAIATLATGSPLQALVFYTTGYVGVGLVLGFASHTLMSEYAIMLKKRGNLIWRRWRRARLPRRRVERSNGRSRGARRVKSS